LLCCDFKGDSAKEQLVGENTNTPDINFVVISFPLEKFWGDIERGSAEGSSHSVCADRPTEIADFH
jgi:hypothetical protein